MNIKKLKKSFGINNHHSVKIIIPRNEFLLRNVYNIQ